MKKLKVPSPPALLSAWLPFAIAITILSGVIYGAVQQSLRMGANDLPIQISLDAAQKLKNGDDPDTVLPDQVVVPGKSLAPFVIVLDKTGKIDASSLGEVDGEVPLPPKGVFDYTRQNGEDRITWELKQGQRFAIVVRYFYGDKHSGFVLVGRDLHEVEEHESQIALLVLAGWFAAMTTTFIAVWANTRKASKRR